MTAPVLTLKETARALGLRLKPGQSDVKLAGVSTDSRTIRPGELFVALEGVNFDGHRFVRQAFEKGAAAAVIGKSARAPRGRPCLKADDTLTALGDLAGYVRRRRPLKVVAVTGSNGKTTTKEMIDRILGRKYKTLASEGNFNNLVGLPLTLFRLKPGHEAAVLEMGMNRPGEIARLTDIAAPDVGLVTNVGPAHLEGLGNLTGVATAKGELFRGLVDGSVGVVNLDDPMVLRQAAVLGGRRMTFGFDKAADVYPRSINQKSLSGCSFTLVTPRGEARVKTGLLGRHNIANVLAAAAATIALGITPKRIAAAIENFPAYPGRLNPMRLPGRIHLLDDTYNANPASTEAALEVLDAMRGRGRAIAVLGDMLELGKVSGREHARIGRKAAGLGVDVLVVVGPESRRLGLAAKQSETPPSQIRWFTNKAFAAEWLQEELRPHDRVLVKGSRGMNMEEIVRLLVDGGIA